MKTKTIGAFEITSRAVKFVVGYVLDGEVVVLKKALVPLEDKAASDGVILDYAQVAKAISIAYKEGTSSLEEPLKETVIVLPPIGFEVFEHSQTTSVVSTVGKIAKLDIDNVLSQVSKARTTDGSAIIDILPDAFILDQGQSFLEPPLGQISNSLMVKAKLHVLPIHLIQSHKKVYNQANIRFDKMVASPYAALEIVKQNKNIPNDFILVDIGAKITTMSLIGMKQLIVSTFEYHGLDEITEKLMSAFGIDFKNAEQLKEMFGFDEEEYAFKAPLFSVISQEKKEKRVVTYNDFKETLGSALHEYASELAYAFKELASQVGEGIKRLPLVVVGGGVSFHGLSEMLKEQLEVKEVRLISPTSLGARNPIYTNCLGAILLEGNKKPLEEEVISEEKGSNQEKTRKIKIGKIDDLEDHL